jgi:hypothetical protein
MRIHRSDLLSLVVRPGPKTKDWGLSLPCAKLGELFNDAFPDIRHIGWRPGKKYEVYTYFKDVDETQIQCIERFAAAVKSLVFIDDTTDGAFALDMHQVAPPYGGLERTEIGLLVYTAKYEKIDHDRREAARAALVDKVVHAVRENPLFFCIESVCAVPSSKKVGGNTLPKLIGASVASALKVPFAPQSIVKTKSTADIKNAPLGDKRGALEGSFLVERTLVENRNILLIDDIYQSGTTIGYITELIRASGAKRALVLAAVKTLRDADNLSGRVSEPESPTYDTCAEYEDIPFKKML